jgi:2-polyprenyl-3-methyl-5-hydroxy-6-metoxy-1,4-benzoquinol methylase
MRCPVCERPSEAPFLTRQQVSVHQNLVVDTPHAARALRVGTLALHACAGCGFVFNAAFNPALLQYGAAYDNTQACSPTFQQHVETRADHIVQTRGVRDATIVEVGCGDGRFLCALARRDAGNRGVGFDPSYVGPDTAVDDRVRFERRFYDESGGGLDPDAIVCRHVIEHVQRPVDLLRTIRRTIRPTDAQIFFETPCVEWILRNDIVWDFFYEHCSYFTAASLAHAFARAGFDADDVSHVFGGQYLWAEGRPAAEVQPPLSRPGASWIVDLARRYAAREAVIIKGLHERVVELSRRGPVAIWGAAAKGVTLANLIDPDATLLACIVDINPNKQGRFLPGSAHPIVGPAEIATLGVRTALVTNPNYFEENSRIVRNAGLNLELVDLMRSNEAHADTD